MTTAVRVPDRLAHTVVAAFGDVGRDWLERLPTLVADVASAWELEVGAPFEPGGNVGWVAPVRRANGSCAALKVECPSHPNPWATKGLRHWDGRGAARLLDSDDARQTMLLELCVPGTNGDELDVRDAPAKQSRRCSPSSTQSNLRESTSSSHLRRCWNASARRCGTASIGSIFRWIEVSSRKRRTSTRPCPRLRQTRSCSMAISGRATLCSPSVDGWRSTRTPWSAIARST